MRFYEKKVEHKAMAVLSSDKIAIKGENKNAKHVSSNKQICNNQKYEGPIQKKKKRERERKGKNKCKNFQFQFKLIQNSNVYINFLFVITSK